MKDWHINDVIERRFCVINDHALLVNINMTVFNFYLFLYALFFIVLVWTGFLFLARFVLIISRHLSFSSVRWWVRSRRRNRCLFSLCGGLTVFFFMLLSLWLMLHWTNVFRLHEWHFPIRLCLYIFFLLLTSTLPLSPLPDLTSCSVCLYSFLFKF